MEENRDYHAYRYGDHLTPGSELKIEHSVVCENVDISTLITMGIDSLEAMRQGSIDGEQKAYECFLLGIHTVRKVCGGYQPATAGF